MGRPTCILWGVRALTHVCVCVCEPMTVRNVFIRYAVLTCLAHSLPRRPVVSSTTAAATECKYIHVFAPLNNTPVCCSGSNPLDILASKSHVLFHFVWLILLSHHQAILVIMMFPSAHVASSFSHSFCYIFQYLANLFVFSTLSLWLIFFIIFLIVEMLHLLLSFTGIFMPAAPMTLLTAWLFLP